MKEGEEGEEERVRAINSKKESAGERDSTCLFFLFPRSQVILESKLEILCTARIHRVL